MKLMDPGYTVTSPGLPHLHWWIWNGSTLEGQALDTFVLRCCTFNLGHPNYRFVDHKCRQRAGTDPSSHWKNICHPDAGYVSLFLYKQTTGHFTATAIHSPLSDKQVILSGSLEHALCLSQGRVSGLVELVRHDEGKCEKSHGAESFWLVKWLSGERTLQAVHLLDPIRQHPRANFWDMFSDVHVCTMARTRACAHAHTHIYIYTHS